MEWSGARVRREEIPREMTGDDDCRRRCSLTGLKL